MIIEDIKYLINNTKTIDSHYAKYFGSIINILNDKSIPNFDADINSLNIKDKNREKKDYNKDKDFKIIIEKSDRIIIIDLTKKNARKI